MIFRYDIIKTREDITTKDMVEWCKENLTTGEVVVGNTAIYIESEIDATAFKLRWL